MLAWTIRPQITAVKFPQQHRRPDTALAVVGRPQRSWAPQASLGLTTRLHRLGRERAFLTFYLVQGLGTLFAYEARYNNLQGHTGFRSLSARGSAAGFSMGLPLKLYTRAAPISAP